jgi:hypothetical protein
MTKSMSTLVLTFAIVLFVTVLVRAEPPSPDSSDIDKQLLNDLPPVKPTDEPAGEDIGSPGEEDPISRIVNQMESSRQRLQKGDTSAATVQLQRQIADDLAELIASMRRQQPRSAASQNQASTSVNPKENIGNPSERQSRDGDVTSEDAPPNAPVGRAIWGHLPSKVREQIRDSAIEEFLPSFEEMIEAYYRRLAEEPEKMLRQN